MAQDLTDCSGLPQRAATVVELVRQARERDLSKDETDLIAIYAEMPLPPLPTAEQDEIRKIVGYLAGSLKTARISDSEGHLKLSAYYRALRDLPLAAVQWAANEAILESDWMPGQATLRKKALQYEDPTRKAQALAQRYIERRKARGWSRLLAAIRAREIPEGDLQDIIHPDDLGYFERSRLLLQLENGALIYWSREREKEILDLRKAQSEAIIKAARTGDEQSNTREGDRENG